jgi:signal transduction histidine kinase
MVLLPVGYVLYTVAVTGTRARTAGCTAAAIALTVLAMALFGDVSVWRLETLEKIALILLPLLAGEAVRAHRAFKREEAEAVERRLRAQAEEADRRIEQERLRIARDVHDVVAHAMVAVNVQAGVAAHVMDRRPEAARDALQDIKRVSGDALRDLRATLGVLRSGADEERAPVHPAQGLDGLGDLAARLRAAGIDCDVDVRRDGRPLPSALEGAGFRIVQEALTNVLRHSGASAAHVAIAVEGGALAIEVSDDGPCPDGAAAAPAGPGAGNGLRGMRERAAAVGGSLEAGPRDGGGWRVAARLPLGVPA